MRILAISGSLRAASSNTALLRAAAVLAPSGVEIVVYDGLAGLPPFNPDLDPDPVQEGVALPPPVQDLRARLRAADGVVIASPEYAHGVPGAFKNALDWLVGSTDFPGMPVALLNASPRATHAQAALAETLRTMSATLVPDASLIVPVAGRNLAMAAIVADPALAGALRAAIAALVRAIERHVVEAAG